MNVELSLGWLDGTILVAYVAALASIGWWAAHRTAKTTEDYFLANRSIPWLVTMASFVATCISALTFIGTPAEGFSSDYRYLLSNPGDILATIFIAMVFLPHFQKLRVTSIYQAVAERFGPSARTTCSAYFLLTRSLASTVRIVAIAKVLEVVTGGGLSYQQCVVIVVGGILAYTTLGGGRAIAWTDLMQFCLLVTGAVSALIYIVTQVPGGVPAIIDAGRHAVTADGTVYNKFNFMEMYQPGNLGLLVLMTVWGFFNSSAAYGTDQDMVQRLLACNDNRKARWSLMIWGLAGIPIAFLFLSIGVGLYAYARVHPELIAGMTDNDHIFPRFILGVMPHGLRGLLLAAVASAAMGSADSALASLSTAFTLDFYKPFWGKGQPEERVVKVSKMSFVGFGLFFMVVAMGLKSMDNLLWLAFRIIAFTYGPLLGIFVVAIMTDWKLSARKVLGLMLCPTVLTFSLAMLAWYQSTHGGGPAWRELHKTYWRFYTIFGTLFVPAGAWLLREKDERPAAAAA
ncbi:MAG: sodium/solute symporter [Elusimicrobia bacterium]|nr:sodium/solute symporter [Elusimicrobiota bacterium]